MIIKWVKLPIAVFCIAFVGFKCFGAERVSLLKDLSSRPVIDLYSGVSDKKWPALARLKSYEIQMRWTDCIALSSVVFQTHKDLQGWVGLTWLRCLDQSLKKTLEKSGALTSLPAILGKIEKGSILFEGPWSADLLPLWVNLKLRFLQDQVQKNKEASSTELELLLHDRFQLSKEQKATVFELLGDNAMKRSSREEALFLYQQGLDYKETPTLKSKVGASPSVSEVSSVELGDEVKLEERIRASLKDNDAVSAIRDMITLFNEYPGSRSAKRMKERVLETYFQISENRSQLKALAFMKDAEAARLLEWAQSLHRRGDYLGSLLLAEASVQKSPASVQSTAALLVAGRSAHFLGRYKEALQFFSKLILQHQGSEEMAEALFRSVLIQYRQKEYSSCVSLLEKLLLLNKEKYELNGRYWLVRALQFTQPDRAARESADLVRRYPFSYYGLRLKAESQQQKVTWPEVLEKEPKLASDIYLVSEQKKSWRRFKELSENGWISEAYKELSLLPNIKDPTLKISFAQKLSLRGQYMTAIRWVNEAMEADPRLRQEAFLRIGYPQAFKEFYDKESSRYGVSAVLLRSLTRQESGFNIRAVSTSNALGLMQMIPPTALEVSKKIGIKLEMPEDMFRPDSNILMGSFYLTQMLGQFQGSVPFALAAYNAGPSRLKNWIESRAEIVELLSKQSSETLDELWFDELPWTETSFYVKAILRNVLLYRLVEEGSFTLNPVLWSDLRNKKTK